MYLKNLLIFVFCLVGSLGAESKYPVDISFLIADLKFSKEHGVKICEIQNGIQSTFYGDLHNNGEPGIISLNFQSVLSQFPFKKWTISSQYAHKCLRDVIAQAPDWENFSNLTSILNDDKFLEAATKVPSNPNDIFQYEGMLSTRVNNIKNYESFRQMYPGIVLMDAATIPFWTDKYKMSQLFNRNPILASIKPEWGLYPKIYSESLAENIINDIPSDLYVIKPRGSFLGYGVIIVSKEKLDSTLKYILTDSKELRRDPDKSYNHWNIDSSDTFIIEKFYPSDPLTIAHLKNKVYHPTMRIAFFLIYNNQEIIFEILGYYWLLPVKSVDQKGSLNERYKAFCKEPYYEVVSDETISLVEEQLRNVMPLFYHEMLEGNSEIR
jgi:hypothetical protein